MKSYIKEIQDRIENELPGRLVLQLRKDWKAIADGRNVTELDECLFWQACQKSFTMGQTISETKAKLKSNPKRNVTAEDLDL